MYTYELLSILDNKMAGYADNSTSMAVVPPPGVRVTVAESMNCDLGKVKEWSDLFGMKLNVNKTKIMMVSRSRTMHHHSHPH